jgi:hypothetical protein
MSPVLALLKHHALSSWTTPHEGKMYSVTPTVCIWFQLVLGSVSVLFILGIYSLQQMSYFGRSHFNASNLAFWQLGVVLGPQMMLFATWGWSIHLDQLLIVEAALIHLLEPQNLTRIVQDLVCGEIFILCRTGQEVDILYTCNVSMDGDAFIFAMVHYLWLSGPHQPIEYLSNYLLI